MSEQQLTDYINKLEVFIDLAKKISDNVIIYITPHSINAVKHNNENDIEILNKFSEDIINELEILKWWDWPKQKIAQNIISIQSGDISKIK